MVKRDKTLRTPPFGRHFLLGYWTWAWAGAAIAGEPEMWASLHDARLMASLKGNPEGALAIYESYIDDLPTDSNLWVQFQYSIGQAKISMGDLSGAREALYLIESHPTVARDVQRLFSEMIRLENQLPVIPYVDEIAIGKTRWILGGAVQAGDELMLMDSNESVLVWTRDTSAVDDGFIYLELPLLEKPLETLQITARSKQVSSRLVVVLEDDGGNQWLTGDFEVPLGDFVDIAIDLRQSKPWQKGVQTEVDYSRIRSLMIQDVTRRVETLRSVSDESPLKQIEISATRLY